MHMVPISFAITYQQLNIIQVKKSNSLFSWYHQVLSPTGVPVGYGVQQDGVDLMNPSNMCTFNTHDSCLNNIVEHHIFMSDR
jgi:hypothetical protein